MAYELCDKLKNLTPYDPAEGIYRIRLDANESFLPLPDEVLEKLPKALERVRFNRYPDPLASELCFDFAQYYRVDPKSVTAGNGSDELLNIIANSFLQRGETVLTLAPDFSMYGFYAELAECRCVRMDKGEWFRIDPDAVIERANQEHAAMVIFSNPCNPTSVLLDREAVRKIIRGVNGLVVLDEAYMDFADASLIREADQYENLILLRTCSKAFGLAAIRLGFAVANPTLTRALQAAKSPYNVNSVTQAIGSAVLSEPEAARRAIEQILISRRSLYGMVQELAEKYPGKIDVIEPQTNFVFARYEDSGELFEFLKKNAMIVRRMGDHLRITAGRNHENVEVTQKIDEFYAGRC